MGMLQLKKWYSDVVTDGGDFAGYTYIMAIRLAGIPFGNVAVHLAGANGGEHRYTKTYRIDERAWGADPVIGGNSILSSGTGTTVSMAIADLELTLNYAGPSGAWSPSAHGALLNDPRCRLNWKVLQSAARVQGSIRIAGNRSAVHGQGYRDLVTMNSSPWAFPVRHLLWGRAHCGEYSVVFNRLELDGERVLSNLLVEKEGQSCPECGDVADLTYDDNGTSRVGGRDCALLFAKPRILEQAPVFTPDRIRPGFVRTFLRRLSRDPIELKLFSEATLEIEGNVVRGYAIHELVRWGKQEVTPGA